MLNARKAINSGISLILLGTAATAGALGTAATPALADTDTGSTTANVDVTSSVLLTSLTPSFTLTGAPGSTPTTGATPVTMTVTTNNFAGYTVTVVPAAQNLVGAIAGNTDVIPANDLEVDGPVQAGTYVHLTYPTSLLVATKASASEPGGDTITNNYRITIPFVRPDIYTGTLNYVVTTL